MTILIYHAIISGFVSGLTIMGVYHAHYYVCKLYYRLERKIRDRRWQKEDAKRRAAETPPFHHDHERGSIVPQFPPQKRKRKKS